MSSERESSLKLFFRLLVSIDMAGLDISEENLQNLKAIQNIISIEEGHNANLDEAFQRVLRFYRQFVPYC